MYKDSLVVFLDILGLTDSIKETETDESKAEPIAQMLAEIQGMTAIIEKRARASWKIKVTAHAFSDSILISCPVVSSEAFISLAHIVARIQFGVMRRQFFLRGGMSTGGHYEKKGVAFGPAYIKAYELEKRSIWPRVLVDPLALKKLPPERVFAALESYLSQDESGLCYLNYLHLLMVQQSLLLSEKRLTKEELTHLDLAEPLHKHKQYLVAAVEILRDNSRLDLLPRYHAVAAYHNSYVKEVNEGLPTKKSYKEVDPATVTGQIISGIQTLASSREGSASEDIDSLLSSFTESLFLQRRSVQECEIDLSTLFGPLYPHLG